MSEVKLRKVADGWQSYIIQNGRVTVLDDFFMEEDRDTALAMTGR